MKASELTALAAAVQRNCDIADARHAAEQSLCIYLLQMRELYRWRAGMGPEATLDRAAVGNWIAEREALWESLETEPYQPLPSFLGDAAVDPFEAAAVNRCLIPLGLLYGAGVVGRTRPVFFLAQLHSLSQREGLSVQQAGLELARGLLAPPAALAGSGSGPIIVRRDALARIGWERVETYRLRPDANTALRVMVRAYGLDGDFEQALSSWLDDQVETAVLHEIGEFRVGQRFGPAFGELRASLPGPRDDAWARALRDCLADLEVTLPTLLTRGPIGAVHAWFAGLDGLRLSMCHELPDAYRLWRTGADRESLRLALDRAHKRLSTLAAELLSLWQREGPRAAAAISQRLHQAGDGIRVNAGASPGSGR